MENKPININIPDSAIEFTKTVYGDFAQQGTKEAGAAIGTIANTFNTLLIPLKLGNTYLQLKADKFIEDLNNKIHNNIPPENIRIPEQSVFAHALEDLKFSLDEDDIRGLYLNLLSSSTDNRMSKLPLRAFVQIIRQLSSLEAKLLSHLFSEGHIYPVATLGYNIEPSGFFFVGKDPTKIQCHNIVTDISLEGLDSYDIDSYLKHFDQLGLIKFDYSLPLAPENLYNYITDHPLYTSFIEFLKKDKNVSSSFSEEYITINKGAFLLTSFGRGFVATCIS